MQVDGLPTAAPWVAPGLPIWRCAARCRGTQGCTQHGTSPGLAQVGTRAWILSVGREAPLPTGMDYFLMYTTIVDGIMPARCAAAASSPEKEP